MQIDYSKNSIIKFLKFSLEVGNIFAQVDRKVPEGEGQEDAYVLFYRRSGLSFTVNLPEPEGTDMEMEKVTEVVSESISPKAEVVDETECEIKMEDDRISHESDIADHPNTIGDKK